MMNDSSNAIIEDGKAADTLPLDSCSAVGTEQLGELKLSPYCRLRKLVSVIVGCQIAVLSTMCGANAFTVVTGTHIALHAAQYDPYDMFRGDYLRIRLDICDAKTIPSVHGDQVYAVLRQGTPYWTLDRVEASVPKLQAGEVMIKGKVRHDFRGEYISYGLDRAYIQERTGSTWGRNHRDGYSANVVVDAFGHAVLTGLQ